MWLKKNKDILILLSLALIARLFFSAFGPFQSDIDSFIAWGEQMYRVGPGNFYSSGIWTDYAPGYMYFLWLIATIKNTFLPEIEKVQYEFLFKAVPMIFDLLTGYVLFSIVKYLIDKTGYHRDPEKSNFLPVFCAGIYLFSPFTFFNSAIWGQADSVFTFFLALSFFYLTKKQFILACVMFVIATIIKPQAAIVAPVYLVYLFKNGSFELFAKSFFASVFTFYALVGPFWGISSLQKLFTQLQSSVNTYPYSSINTFNLWGINGFWKSDTEIILNNLSSQQIGSLLFAVAAIVGTIGTFVLIKKNMEWQRQMFYYAYFSAFMIFTAIMLLTRMHERYLFPLFIYLALIVTLVLYQLMASKSVENLRNYLLSIVPLVFYFIAVIVHTVNIYYVYTQYNYFSVGVPLSNSSYYMIEKSLPFWSFIQIFIYVVFAFSFIYFRKNVSER
jgi:Gpi18-like mannosyltransferase